ncbi:F-box protein At4g00755-like [Phragmites australis]|uniref:F-box protein At4g00755-like n=1 Tax=Phragmites australis TaxID=29695 RepID=UPI002D76F9AB|nr:F-box protein At4g00755-like [Phragmites australis]
MGVVEFASQAGVDFLEWLGPDTSAIVFTLLSHPADLASASAVSRSWRTFAIANQFSKAQCLRLCPEVSNFTCIQQLVTTCAADTTSSNINQEYAGSSEWENHKTDHRVYLHLSHVLLSPYHARDCIIRCIAASSTDNFPEETIENTLEPIDRVEMRPSYWSSGGQSDPTIPECLIYRLHSDLCLIQEIKIQPFKAFFQYGDPIYSAQQVRFRMGYPKSTLRSQDLVSDENEGQQLAADDNYIWTYTSPEFPMLQENVLQSFRLPRTVLCIGGVVKVELLGRIQKQATDGLYYICVSHVQILGNPLSQELAVTPCEDGAVLKYHLQPRISSVYRCDLSGDDGGSPSKWHNFATRIWQSGTGRGIGWNQALLSRLLFGPPLQFVEEDDDQSEEEGA